MKTNVLYEDFKHQRRLTERQFNYYQLLREQKEERKTLKINEEPKKIPNWFEVTSNFYNTLMEQSVNYMSATMKMQSSSFQKDMGISSNISKNMLQLSSCILQNPSCLEEKDEYLNLPLHKLTNLISKKFYSEDAANSNNFFHPTKAEKKLKQEKIGLELIVSEK